MKRFFIILTLAVATFTFTGCEQKTGTRTYFRQDGTVTQVNQFRDSLTGETVFRSNRMTGQQYQSKKNGEQIIAIGKAVGKLILGGK